ncbi:MAG: adenosine deaminase family protein [Deltaproteobacteria bacterium]|nr:MAG: adenosine deaminase family protein [Deltaproteobacteria bacterium]
MNGDFPREFLLKIPKTDLHVHLDGSLRLGTLIELARESGVKLPSYTEEGLLELVFKEQYQSLDEYLKGFGLTNDVMRTPEQLERIAYELAADNQQEGVRYIEVRFAPQLHTSKHMDTMQVIRSVCEGLERAKKEFNSRPEIVSGKEPPFEYGLIACALRYFNEHFSSYHRSFLALHRYTPRERVYSLASMELAHAAAHANRHEGLPVVGFDLAGSEEGYPPHRHREAYEYAHRNFLKKTVHAGEAYGPESIFKAITELHADRIGHGTSLLNPEAISDPDITDRQRYVEDLVQFIADRRITIEVCLTSNQQTNPAYRDLTAHPFGRMMERKLSLTICTDNRTVSRTTVTDEYAKACKIFGLSLRELKNLVVYGFKRSFFPHKYARKREYVRKSMEYFERVAKEFGYDV